MTGKRQLKGRTCQRCVVSDPLEALPWQSGSFPGSGVYVCRLAEHLRENVPVKEFGAWVVTLLPDGRSREEGWDPRRVYPSGHDYTNDAAAIEWVRVGGT